MQRVRVLPPKPVVIEAVSSSVIDLTGDSDEPSPVVELAPARIRPVQAVCELVKKSLRYMLVSLRSADELLQEFAAQVRELCAFKLTLFVTYHSVNTIKHAAVSPL